MTIPAWVKPGIWGAVIGAVIIMIVAFATGWVVSSGSADEMAETRADKAVMAALTPICVAQFKNATKAKDTMNGNRGTFLTALKEEDSWKRGDFVEKHGWATMPGSAKPNQEVASACAAELMKLTQKMNSK